MKTTCTLLAITALLCSCENKTGSTASTAPASSNVISSELEALLAAPIAGEAKPIHLVRQSAKPGDEITISGQIMGNKNPFVAGRAVFILGDPGVLTPCNAIPGDGCETPWDNCCDSPEDKKRGTVSIQIVDAAGRALKQGIEGSAGIEKLAHVTVTGKVTEGSSADLLVINATAIRVGK